MTDYDEYDSTSTFSFRYKYDIFLSFRGEDTRHGFTDRLYKNLIQNGVRTFRDDDELERGEEIAPSLVEAIHDSAAAIAVISKRYADSRWCLEELAMIVESRKLLLPVFYEVDPSDVRRQKGSFEEDFRLLEDRFGVEKVVRWRNALEKSGSTSGWDSKLWEEEKLIQSLVKKVLAKLSNTPLDVAKYPVGLNSCLEALMNILDVKANGIKFLGIHGMGGAGKTTLARALYNKLVIYFKRRSFISDVRETSREKHGLTILQNKLISDLSQRKTVETSRGILSIRELIQEEPVLIVLDDIDDSKQLEDLVGNNREWFYEGSRIIMTTRDKEAIPERIVDAFYEVEQLKFPEAVELFSYHAFGRGKPTKDLVDLSEKIVNLTGGLPLALEVFGSLFYDKRKRKDWLETLKKLEQVRPGEIQDVLKISFESLDQQEKCAFLDIACFFVDMKMKREDVVYILKGYGFSGETLIMTLIAKSLIKIIESDTLWMHDQLKNMGKQIVQDENSDIGMRSRLWDYNGIMNVLKNKKGTRCIEGIALDIDKTRDDLNNKDTRPENFRKKTPFSSFTCWKKIFKTNFHQEAENKKDVALHAKSFKPMVNLRFLKIDDVQLEGSFKLIPAELKCLQWKRCYLSALPSEFCVQHLAVLDLSESKIEQLLEKSFYNLRNLNNSPRKLLVLNLQGCQHLTYLPDLSFHSDLEKVNLERCKALVKLHKSVGDLKKLHYLNLNDCENLVEFPSDVSGLKYLEILVLSGCSKLKELPDDLRSMGCLRKFLIDDTAITKLPDSIFHLKKLEIFSLTECRSLKQLPHTIGRLDSLKELHLDGSGLEEIPSSIGSLTELEMLTLIRCKALISLPDTIGDLKSLLKLFLDRSAIMKLPTSIGSLLNLKHLSVSHCHSLTKLPDAIGGLASLITFSLEGSSITEIPGHIGSCSMIEKLNMRSCTSISVLPESMGDLLSITTLVLDNIMITELPESIGRLERLTTLRLNECKQLQRLPAAIGNLKSLCYFLMELTSVPELPDELGKLSSLKILKLGKKSYALRAPQSSYERELAKASTSRQIVIPKSFYNLSSLQQLDICAWEFCGEIPDEFEKLSSMEELNLSCNNFFSLPSSLRGLSILKKLNLSQCKELISLPPLPSSLIDLNCANCSQLNSVGDLTNLTSLRDLNLTNCNKLIDIPGFQFLKSLRMLNMGGCNTCFPAVKERLAKVALKHLIYLSIPGSAIPDWFIPELPRFASPRNRDVKSIIIAVVISLDQQTTDLYRDKLPAVVDIKLAYYKPDQPVPEFSRVLKLMGVPKTNEDHLYLCRFHEFHPPVFMLKEGYRIQITMREPPLFNGLRLKKHGFHLIFENDDFDEDDEELLNESQRSVSWKLAKFIGSLLTN